MAKILCIGHSHVTALHLGQWAPERAADERNVWSFFRLPTRTLPAFVARAGTVERADRLIRRLIQGLFETVEFDVLVTSFGGHIHAAIALAQPPRPYDFHLPGRPDLPADPDVELVPYAIARKQLAARYDPYTQLMLDAARLTQKPILHVTQPPPTDETAYIEKYPGGFKKLIGEHGVSPAGFRLKYWLLQQDVIGETCRALGIPVVPLPAGTTDDAGYLDPECRANDPNHGNRRFGALILNDLEDSLPALMGAGAAARAKGDGVATPTDDAVSPDGEAGGEPDRASVPDPLVVLAPQFSKSLYDAIEAMSITQASLRLRLIEQTQVPNNLREAGASLREEVARVMARRPVGPILSLVGIHQTKLCLYATPIEDISRPDEAGRGIDRLLTGRLGPSLAFLDVLRREAPGRVLVQLSPPPPVPDAFFRASGDGAPSMARARESVLPAAVRLDVWRRAVAILAARCAALDIGFVAVPPELMDGDGFLAREHWGREVMDTGMGYARHMLDRVDDHLGAGEGGGGG